MSRIYLGRDLDNETVYLSKHSWDCKWYWGFGYVGNNSCHYHIDSLFNETNINKIFTTTKLTQDNWWVVGDLFIQAYTLKKCAETYRHGGHWTEQAFKVADIRDEEMCTRLNKDLETILDSIWEYIEEAVK